jgi:hypothetical protein
LVLTREQWRSGLQTHSRGAVGGETIVSRQFVLGAIEALGGYSLEIVNVAQPDIHRIAYHVEF